MVRIFLCNFLQKVSLQRTLLADKKGKDNERSRRMGGRVAAAV
jgi:hypothetical protein